MKFLKRIIREPKKYPDKSPERILREDYDWWPAEIRMTKGRIACLYIELTKLKHAIWEELTK